MRIHWYLVFVLAACGSVTANDPDGSLPDPDAPEVPVDNRPVKVIVLTSTGDGLPELTARVLFQDAAGNLVLDGMVDQAGQIESPLPTGGTVTTIRITDDTPAQLRAELSTITGVRPGDDLTFGAKARPTITNQGGQTSMTFDYTPVTNATSHVFSTTCDTASGTTMTGPPPAASVALDFRDPCHGATFDVLGVASGTALAAPRFLHVKNVMHEAGAKRDLVGAFIEMKPFTVTTLNVPPGLSNMAVARASLLDHTPVAAQSESLANPAAGTIATSVPFAQGVGTRSEVNVTLNRSGAAGFQRHSMRTPTLTPSATVDLDQQTVPWLADVTGTPSGITWTTTVGGDPDGMAMRWAGQWTVGSRTTIVGWRVAQPFAATGMTLPRLPPAYAELDPQAQTTTITAGHPTLSIVNFDVVDGYDAFRQQPETLSVATLEQLGAFVGMPVQRRMFQVFVIF